MGAPVSIRSRNAPAPRWHATPQLAASPARLRTILKPRQAEVAFREIARRIQVHGQLFDELRSVLRLPTATGRRSRFCNRPRGDARRAGGHGDRLRRVRRPRPPPPCPAGSGPRRARCARRRAPPPQPPRRHALGPYPPRPERRHADGGPHQQHSGGPLSRPHARRAASQRQEGAHPGLRRAARRRGPGTISRDPTTSRSSAAASRTCPRSSASSTPLPPTVPSLALRLAPASRPIPLRPPRLPRCRSPIDAWSESRRSETGSLPPPAPTKVQQARPLPCITKRTGRGAGTPMRPRPGLKATRSGTASTRPPKSSAPAPWFRRA